MNAPLPDALKRLSEERRQLEDLFGVYARQQAQPARPVQPGQGPIEAARLSTLIFTLLRVHDEIATSLLQARMAHLAQARPVLEKSALRRQAVMDAVEQLAAQSPQDPARAESMALLARLTSAWFECDETEVFEVARGAAIDLEGLDAEIASRQETLLSAGG